MKTKGLSTRVTFAIKKVKVLKSKIQRIIHLPIFLVRFIAKFVLLLNYFFNTLMLKIKKESPEKYLVAINRYKIFHCKSVRKPIENKYYHNVSFDSIVKMLYEVFSDFEHIEDEIQKLRAQLSLLNNEALRVNDNKKKPQCKINLTSSLISKNKPSNMIEIINTLCMFKNMVNCYLKELNPIVQASKKALNFNKKKLIFINFKFNQSILFLINIYFSVIRENIFLSMQSIGHKLICGYKWLFNIN